MNYAVDTPRRKESQEGEVVFCQLKVEKVSIIRPEHPVEIILQVSAMGPGSLKDSENIEPPTG